MGTLSIPLCTSQIAYCSSQLEWEINSSAQKQAEKARSQLLVHGTGKQQVIPVLIALLGSSSVRHCRPRKVASLQHKQRLKGKHKTWYATTLFCSCKIWFKINLILQSLSFIAIEPSTTWPLAAQHLAAMQVATSTSTGSSQGSTWENIPSEMPAHIQGDFVDQQMQSEQEVAEQRQHQWKERELKEQVKVELAIFLRPYIADLHDGGA